MYDKLVARVNNIDTSGFVLETKYDTDNSHLEKTLVGLLKKLDYNAKITEIENKISSISGFATNAALTTVENKVPNIKSLVKKQIITSLMITSQRITDDNHDKYIATPEFNKFITKVFDARLARANLITKTDFDTKLISPNIYLLKMN